MAKGESREGEVGRGRGGRSECDMMAFHFSILCLGSFDFLYCWGSSVCLRLLDDDGDTGDWRQVRFDCSKMLESILDSLIRLSKPVKIKAFRCFCDIIVATELDL